MMEQVNAPETSGVLQWSVLLCVGGFCPDVACRNAWFPVPRQQAFHFRFELAGDSFQEQLQNSGDAEATSGRGLVSVVFGLTNWSEIYVRAGLAEFNVDEALFRAIMVLLTVAVCASDPAAALWLNRAGGPVFTLHQRRR